MKYYLKSRWCGDEWCACITYRVVDENDQVVSKIIYTDYDMMEDEDFLEDLKELLIQFNPKIDELDKEVFGDWLNGISNELQTPKQT